MTQMGVSASIAATNRDRFAAYRRGAAPSAPEEGVAREAGLAFTGAAYLGLDAGSLDEGSVAYAQRSIRVLCGLYGVLRLLDIVQVRRASAGV